MGMRWQQEADTCGGHGRACAALRGRCVAGAREWLLFVVVLKLVLLLCIGFIVLSRRCGSVGCFGVVVFVLMSGDVVGVLVVLLKDFPFCFTCSRCPGDVLLNVHTGSFPASSHPLTLLLYVIVGSFHFGF